jgi:hypothetical protein
LRGRAAGAVTLAEQTARRARPVRQPELGHGPIPDERDGLRRRIRPDDARRIGGVDRARLDQPAVDERGAAREASAPLY